MNGKLYETDFMIASTQKRSAITAFDVDGGAPIVLGGVNAKETGCKDATKFATGKKQVAIAYNPTLHFVMENGVKLPARSANPDETYFTGDVVDCFVPEVGVEFGVVMGNVDGDTKPTVGQFLEPKNGATVYSIKDSATADTPSFEVIRIEKKRVPTGEIGGKLEERYIVKTVYNG